MSISNGSLVSYSVLGDILCANRHLQLTGVTFNDTQDPRLLIAAIGQAVLRDKLIGLQLGNEPDL